MSDEPIDREAVEELAAMWNKRGYVAPQKNPHDYAAPASCAEAMKTSDTLRALLAARDADAARLEALEAELNLMKTAEVIEVAVRNPSVMDYMKHWKNAQRPQKAKAERLRKALKYLVEITEAQRRQHTPAPRRESVDEANSRDERDQVFGDALVRALAALRDTGTETVHPDDVGHDALSPHDRSNPREKHMILIATKEQINTLFPTPQQYGRAVGEATLMIQHDNMHYTVLRDAKGYMLRYAHTDGTIDPHDVRVNIVHYI